MGIGNSPHRAHHPTGLGLCPARPSFATVWLLSVPMALSVTAVLISAGVQLSLSKWLPLLIDLSVYCIILSVLYSAAWPRINLLNRL